MGPTGKAYGIDFLHEMIEVARANAAEAGVTNAEFLAGMIEDIPLPDGTVDVVISNCVITLAPDKAPVFAEIARVLRPGGRVAVSDVVAGNGVELRHDGTWSECGSGALQHDQYLTMLSAAGLDDVSVEFTHQTGPGLEIVPEVVEVEGWWSPPRRCLGGIVQESFQRILMKGTT